MSITMKKDAWKVKDPSTGNYRDSAIFSTTLPEDAAQIVEDSTDLLEAQAAEIISDAQDAVDGIEAQKDTMIASIASIAGQGTDTTLTQSGVAADAKATGDKLTEQSENIDDLTFSVGDNLVPYPVSFNKNTFWNIETSTAVLTSLTGNWIASDPIGVTPGDRFVITANQGTTSKARIWVATDDNLNIIAMPEDHNANSAYTVEIEIPVGATKLLITTTRTTNTVDYALVNKVTSYPVMVDGLDDKVVNRIRKPIRFGLGTLNPSAGSTQTSSTVVRTGAFKITHPCIISCDESVMYRVYVYEGNVASSFIYTMGVITNKPTVVYPGKYIRIISSYPNSATITDANAFNDLVHLDYLIYKQQDLFKDKKLSLLGDSISSFIGTIPEGYTPYYDGDRGNVTNASQMWWSILCKNTGMTPLVINAESGAGVTQLEDSEHLDKTPMSSDTKCSALSADDVNPDVIIIAGGLNDYTYAQSAQSEPLAWDGTTVPILSNSFTEAYACMIEKLKTNYPNALIVALSTWFSTRGTDNGYTFTHTVGSNTYQQTDYNNAIKNVCDLMHIPFIDVSNIGFTKNNFYPNFAEDSETVPTHPSKFGQAVIGEYITKELARLGSAIEAGWMVRAS